MRAVLSEPRVACVSDNRQQPRAAVSAVIAAEEFESAKARFLHNIFRVRVVASEPARKIVRSIQVLQYNIFKARESVLFRQPSLLQRDERLIKRKTESTAILFPQPN